MRRATAALALAAACRAGPVVPDGDGDPVGESDVEAVDSEVVDSPVDTGAPGDRVAALAPVLWLDAADLVGGDGDRVAAWPGRAGGVGGAQDDVARQPRLRTVDGAARLRLDGVDDRLDLGALALGDAATLAVVAAVGDGDGALLGGATAELRLGVTAGAPALAVAGAGGVLDLRGDAPLADGLHLIVAVVADHVTTLWVDGRPVRTSTGTPGALDGPLALGGLAAGIVARDALAADVAGVVVLDRAVGGCDRAALERALAARHGLRLDPAAPLPSTWLVADDLVGGVGDDGAVTAWAARPTSGRDLAATAAGDDRAPTLGRLGTHRAVRFDGVDDRLDLPLAALGDRARLTLAVVLSTTDPSGHLLGTGASVDGALRTYGTGLALDGGHALAKARDGDAGLLVEGGAIADGVTHVVLAELDADRVELAVDMAGQVVVGTPAVFPFVRASLGASDGSAADAAVDPLAVDVADVRIWEGPLDVCDRNLLYLDTLRLHGAPTPAGPNLPQ